MKENKINFSIEDMQFALLDITKQIQGSTWIPDVILSINRGGCVPGVYLSHSIKTPHNSLIFN